MISAHFERFNTQLHSRLPQSGVYTNQGFVTSWAAPMDAWLPKYAAWVAHYGRQPKEAIDLTWAQLKEHWLPDYEIVLSAGQKPEHVMGHQFTGDRCYLPGSYGKNVGKEFPHGGRFPLDVNVFSKKFIDAIRLNLPPGPPPGPVPGPTTSDYIVLYARINVRAGPSGNATWVRFAEKDEVLKVASIANGWAQLADGTYVFADYIAIKPTVPPAPPPPPPPTPGPGTVDYVVTPARINVRAAPSGNATWVRFAVKDEVLKVVTIANGWAQMMDGTYVLADYIVIKPTAPVPPTPPPTPSPTPAPPPGPVTVDYVVIYARINVRAKASSDSGWVRFAVKDEVLQVVNIANGWAQLADGMYVFADYIRKV